MFGTDLKKQVAVFLAIKAGHRVGATEGERVGLSQVVPQLLETNRGLSLSFRPQQSHHFPKRDNTARFTVVAGRDFCNHSAHYFNEKSLVGASIPHDLRQSLGCIQRDVPPLRSRLACIQAPSVQSPRQSVPMFLGRDDDRGFPSSKSGTNESAQFVEQESIFSVELNYVPRLAAIAPMRRWRER